MNKDLTDATATPGADQHAHVTYFDQRTQLSFYWNGVWANGRIGISHGGYGEPVITSITGPRNDGVMLSFTERLALFEVVCQRYIAGLDSIATVGMVDEDIVRMVAREYDQRYGKDFLHVEAEDT